MKSAGAGSFRHPGGLTGYPTSFKNNSIITEVQQISERICPTVGIGGQTRSGSEFRLGCKDISMRQQFLPLL
jgi:hypothetical protein